MEKNGYNESLALTTKDKLRRAHLHMSIWRQQGTFAEPYHLQKAKGIFFDHFSKHMDWNVASDWIEFMKLHLFDGNLHEAQQILLSKVIGRFETHPKYTNYLFYAGVISKALGEYDRANHYFFEATQCGPPKPFNKIDMMTIISRTLEELSNGDVEADTEDAYKMVHAHLKQEGYLEKQSFDYEDWLYDAKTWMVLAEKCVTHEMYSMASDFYTMSITRDPEAFIKPLLWKQFAKSCRLCGRILDGQLALKVPLRTNFLAICFILFV